MLLCHGDSSSGRTLCWINGLPGRFSTDQRSRRGGPGKGCGAAHMRLLGRKLLILNAISDAFLFPLIIFH